MEGRVGHPERLENVLFKEFAESTVVEAFDLSKSINIVAGFCDLAVFLTTCPAQSLKKRGGE